MASHTTYAPAPTSPQRGLDALVSELSLGSIAAQEPPASYVPSPAQAHPQLPNPYAQQPVSLVDDSFTSAHSASGAAPGRARPDSFYPPQQAQAGSSAAAYGVPSSSGRPFSPEYAARPTQTPPPGQVPTNPSGVGHPYYTNESASLNGSAPSSPFPGRGRPSQSPLTINDHVRSASRGPATPSSLGGHNTSASFLGSRPATPQPQSPFGVGYQPAKLASASRIFEEGSKVLRPGGQAALLSHEKTLELYRKNAKKVQDQDLMYELAVFMIESSRSGQVGGQETAEGAELVKEALTLLRKIADRGHPDAQYFLADCYANGLGSSSGKPQFDKAYPLFVLAAKHAHSDAAYRAGTCTERGWGCRKDSSKAIQFYKKAAAQGHPGAMYRLATAELNGELGLKKNAKEGVKWIKLSADMATPEFPHALHELALLHERGIDNVVFPDHDYACELLAQGAELGYAPSAYKLGINYEYGKMGCLQDPGLSIHMYNIAAQQNHKEACFALCAWYLVGAPGLLPQSDTEAYLWAKKAAEQGLAKAQYSVGYFTEMGIGTKRNLPEAKAWYQSALEHGDKRASTRLASMGRVQATPLPPPTSRVAAAPSAPAEGRMPYAYPASAYQGSAVRLPHPTTINSADPALIMNDVSLPVAGTGLGTNTRPVSQVFGQPLQLPEGQFQNAQQDSLAADQLHHAPSGAPSDDPHLGEKKKKKGWFR